MAAACESGASSESAARQSLFLGITGGQEPEWESEDQARQFAEMIKSFEDDPLGFVCWNWPWGVEGTRLGPDPKRGHPEGYFLEKWQIRVLYTIGEQIRQGRHTIRIAVASGHGIGKSALIAMIITWFNTTHPNPQIICTANTDTQLRGKTWRELAVWQNMGLCGHMFKWTATKQINKDHPGTWYASAIPWSETNPEAFAGTHEKNVLMLFDEASGIANIIWETAFGALTTPGCIMICFGNPTQNHGYFFDCFGKYRSRWTTLRVDGREVSLTNKELIAEWAHDYGEDSDYFRVRVRGLHPNASTIQFISFDVVKAARERAIENRHLSPSTPLLMGVDIAREGDDHSAIVWRRGAKMYPYRRYQIKDTMVNAAYISKMINDTHPDTVFVDATGVGGGVFDRLVQLGHDNCVPVHVGEAADEKGRFVNKRIEIWDRMRDWLKTADIPDVGEQSGEDAGQRMTDELCGPQYTFERRTERMLLEPKRDMKARGEESPDVADALAMTFTYPVPVKRETQQGMTEPEHV